MCTRLRCGAGRLFVGSLKVYISPFSVPLTLAVDLIKTAWQRRRCGLLAEPRRLMRQTCMAVLMYGVWGVLADGLSMSVASFHNVTDEQFIPAERTASIVVIDGFADHRLYDAIAADVLKTLARDQQARTYPNLHVIHPNSIEELAAELNRIARSGPIERLDFYGHGNPGAMTIGEDWFSEGHIEDFAVLLDQGAIATGAMVRLNHCFVGRGARGRRFMQQFASAVLGDGGTAFAATVPTTWSVPYRLSEYCLGHELPGWLKVPSDAIYNPIRLATSLASLRLYPGGFQWRTWVQVDALHRVPSGVACR